MCDVPKSKALILLVIGLVLIFVRLYTEWIANWDIWVVIGALMIVKAVILLFYKPVAVEDPKKK